MTFRGVAATWLCTAMLLLTVSPHAQAAPVVLATVDDLGGGLFQYNLKVNNAGGAEPISGLLVLFGGTVFGLDGFSIIGAPPDWDFFAPVPPVVDDLFYLSLDPAADVPIDGTLGGFFFRSMKDPSTLAPGDFAVDVIGADSAEQIPLGDARVVPEPASLVLVGCGLCAYLVSRRRVSKQNVYPGE